MCLIEIDLALDFLGDVPGQREVGLTQIALDYLLTLQLQLANLRSNSKCVFTADTAGAFGEKPPAVSIFPK